MGESSTRKPRKPRTYGPIQLGNVTGLAQWQIERLLDRGTIPKPDDGDRWSADKIDEIAADPERMKVLRFTAGKYPDMGAGRCAEILAEAYGCDVEPYVVAELARMGMLPEVGDYKGHPMYCGQHLEAMTQPKIVARPESKAILDKAITRGRLHTGDEAAMYLKVRRSDFDHLVAANWIEPVKHAHSGWQRRRESPAVALYRTGDLDVLLDHPGIDWAAVRATPKGRPSPLARITTKPRKVTA